MIFPQWGGGEAIWRQFHAVGDTGSHDRRVSCFWRWWELSGSFIKPKAITKQPLQKRWRLDQSASTLHTHHSKSPGRSTGTEIGWNPLQSQWEAILMISKVECKSQLCKALKIYLLLLICLFWKGGWGMHWRHATLYKSTNKFQTMVPALAKAVVQCFNKLIGIYSCYCTLLISSLKLLLGTSGWRPQTSAFF